MGYLYLYGATVQRRKGTKVEVEVEVETARLKEQSDIVPRSGSMTARLQDNFSFFYEIL